MSEAKYTRGPWDFRLYTMSDSDVADCRRLGLKPVRLLGNDGSATVMSGADDDRKPVARIECQTKAKRGEAYKTECAERDANARLIAAAPDFAEAGSAILDYAGMDEFLDADNIGPRIAFAIRKEDLLKLRAAIAKATGAQP